MISIFLFAACQFGLTQGNPDYIYSQSHDNIFETQEDIPYQDVPTPSAKQMESTHHADTTFTEGVIIPDEFIVEETPKVRENIIYENGIFETPDSVSPLLEKEEQDSSMEESLSGDDCFVEIELLCGPDGWVDRQLYAQTDDNEHYFWNSSCENEEQSWDYYLSAFFTLTLSHGEELILSLCDEEENCGNIPSKDLGIRVFSNDSELENIQTPSAWSFAYTCQ